MNAKILGLILLAAFSVGSAHAVTITGYDVSGASASGDGNWGHTYTGAITPSGAYFDYSGGSGTLADGIVPDGATNNQLFRMASIPTVTLHLSATTLVSSIEIFGGNVPNNGLPGTLAGWSVSIGNSTVALAGIPTGAAICGFGTHPCNAVVHLVGTGLESIATTTVFLSQFTSNVQGFTSFNIGEITVDGALAPPAVPELDTWLLTALGLSVIGVVARRRRAGCSAPAPVVSLRVMA